MLSILAHPDDESLGLGGLIARYTHEGVDVHLVTATRGQAGWFGAPEENPGKTELGRIREGELSAAAEVLGIREVTLLDHVDGELDTVDQEDLTRELVGHIRRVRPHVIVTFDHNGLYGHPDHIAATRAATAAAMAASDPDYGDQPPHTVSKMYYLALTRELSDAYEKAFGELVMQIDGAERRPVPWPHWAISTWVDTSAHWETVWEAIRCHRSQLPGYQKLLDLPKEYHQVLWGRPTLHRVFSLVPTPNREDDIFAGLR
jgi:LmbE family N-acetylglucosaminyl deacetylase